MKRADAIFTRILNMKKEIERMNPISFVLLREFLRTFRLETIKRVILTEIKTTQIIRTLPPVILGTTATIKLSANFKKSGYYETLNLSL